MPAISKIRLTNVVYEEGNKRYNDEVFLFDGHNGAVLLENGGGKTVLIQTALQAILPHVDFAERKIKHTLQLENAPAHIAIEWIHHDQPRRYLVTAVSLFLTKHGLDSLRYVYEYDPHDKHGLDHLPFVRDGKEGKRTAERGEMVDYYASMREKSNYAQTFQTIKEYKTFLETEYHIITSEWESIVKINSTEGGVEAFFNECKNTNQLFDRLLIPTVENAIVGHDEHLFADMFERQYTSFKNYKKLKHTLEENKRIEQQLEAYVATCKTEHDQHLSYIASKGKAKGIWEETLSQKKTSQLELEELNRKVEEWKKTNLHNKMKKASLEIQLDKATLHQLEAEYNQLLREQEEKQEQLRDQQQRYYSLKYSERKEKLTEQQQLYNHAIEELEKLAQTEEVYEVEEALEEVKRKLLGYYIKQIEMFEADKKSVDLEITQTMALLEDTNETVIKLSKDERASLDSLAKIAGTIEARKEDMERIKQQILANPKQETVMAELEKWQRRYQFLDEEIIHLLQQQKKLQSEKQTLSDAIEKRREEKVEIEKDRARLSSQITMISEAEAELIAQLVKTRPQWASIENVYLQQDSIEKRIIETEEQLKASRNDLLHQERIAYRFVDDYGKQDIFFSDSFLEQQLQSWKNQFDYVITGVEYVQHLSEAEQEARKHDHIWPLILVTTNKSKHKLMEKVEKIADRLQFPITVMTSEEAASNSHSNTWILPMHWQTNMNPEQFSEWKQQICEYAKEQTTLREKKESEVKEWNELLGAFQRFFEKYPHEFVNQVKEQLSKIENQIEENDRQINKENRLMQEITSTTLTLSETIDQHRNELNGLDSKLEKAQRYQNCQKEYDEQKKKHQQLQDTLKKLTRELNRWRRNAEEFTSRKDDLLDRSRTIANEIDFVKRDDDYKKVINDQPIYSQETKRVLKERMTELEMKLQQINRTAGEWQAKRDAAKSLIERLNAEMNELKNEHPYVNDSLPFPAGGKQLLDSIWSQMKKIESDLFRVNQLLADQSSLKERQSGKVQVKEEQFAKDYPGETIIEFTDDLAETKVEIHQEKKALIERKQYLDSQVQRVEKDLKSISEAERGLDRFIEGHHFNAPDILPIPLTPDEKTEFSYQRNQFVHSITSLLTSEKDAVEEMKKQVETAKRKFREFCLHKVSDIKLQQMALSGVERKQAFDEVRDFKKNMLMRIERVSHYANEHIRQSDEDLQLFINQIHTHLLTLVEELAQIPKKTKVKVGSDWKQIFSFTIPQWQEEDGKARIRDYIDWILEQLDTERFLTAEGTSDDTKVRKEIETWLQSKQLIHVVLNHHELKVNCRKVTNDNQVSTRSYSWEQSNVWSGGEKWSKNMTLFLGILNYVAEKKQHVAVNMKRHRAVILDNPFGKASSDHVLSPVFFVAEQLGFQIIALTAHAEGKFLQDYFPVIYSCRLRAAADSSKKVMTKEKWLHHAYFQDHEPRAIERLGETEQLALFES